MAYRRLPLFGSFVCYICGKVKQTNYGSKSF